MDVPPSRWPCWLLLPASLTSPPLFTLPALAGPSEEVARQARLAEEDLTTGNF